MHRTKRSIFFLAGGVLAASWFATANGQVADELTILETHEVQCVVSSDTLTNWEDTCEIPLYNPADHGGSQLDSVMLTLFGSATSVVDITANTATTLNPASVRPSISNPGGIAGAIVTAGWTAGGNALTINAFPESAIVNTQDLALAANEMRTLADLSGSDQATLTTSGVDNTDVYVDTSTTGDGTFSVTLSAIADAQPPYSSGGNFTLEQSTIAGAQFVVQYKTLQPLPEPSAGLMASFAFLGVLGLRRRR